MSPARARRSAAAVSAALDLTRDLCRYATGVVADDNEPYFARIAEELPLELHRYPSGAEVNGWLVPELWRVHKAEIRLGGRMVYDAAVHPLGVATYSKSFSGELSLEDLRARLVTSDAHPGALVYHCMWQYRPWDAEWALAAPLELVAALEPGTYRVELETSYEPGEMIVATCDHRGRSDRTIVLNAHTCHPGMANDDNAGVAILVRLFQELRQRETEHSYRLVLGPEHLGTVFYLASLDPGELERLVCGAFCEMPGTPGPVVVASSFLGDQPVDRAFANAARHHAREHRLVGWRLGAGNDETVWEAPGYEVPFVEVSRSQSLWEPYAEYHTSLDTPELLDGAQLEEQLDVFRAALRALDEDVVADRLFNGLPALSSPRYRLYRERPDPAVAKELPEDAERWGYLADSLLRLFDGRTTMLEIAERFGLPFDDVLAYVRRFEEKGLVRLEPAPLSRVQISERAHG